MSLVVTLHCDGHRHGTHCRTTRAAGHGYSPTHRTDDPDRRLVTPGLLDGWRPGAAPHGGDLCPATDHDEDRRASCTCLPHPYGGGIEEDCPVHGRDAEPAPPPGQYLAHAHAVLAARAANEGLT